MTEPDDTKPAELEDAAAPSPEDERVAELLSHTIDVPILAEAVERQEAADAADTLERLEEEEAADVLVAMDDPAAAEALAEMEQPLARGVLLDLIDDGQAAYASRLLDVMAPDDAADLLQALEDAQREAIYAEMTPETARSLRRLAGYDEDSAGGLMTTEYVALRDDQTVVQATEVIRGGIVPEDMNHLPVVDGAGKIVGLVALRSLFLSAGSTPVADLMERSPQVARIDLHREQVAHTFDRYDHFVLPVVDYQDRLVGIVTVDDVIDIIREEQTEDVQKTVGAGAEEAVYSKLGEKLRGRFPWLTASLFMTCGAAAVVLFFEDLIARRPIVAFLMPVIAALVGNSGHQALAVTLRGITLDEVHPGRVRPLLVREAAVGLLNGIGLGIVMTLVVGALSLAAPIARWQDGMIAGLALAVSMCAGTLAGSSIPLVMRRVGADPAQSSAIFLIMITDAVGFATFLGLASLADHWFC